jgi:hypothetical protein
MGFYRKKPVVIEAVQLEDLEIRTLMALQHFVGLGNDKLLAVSDGVLINTLEGDMKASIGDFIIKGVQGEFYPCKPDIFEKTYELVAETE